MRISIVALSKTHELENEIVTLIFVKGVRGFDSLFLDLLFLGVLLIMFGMGRGVLNHGMGLILILPFGGVNLRILLGRLGLMPCERILVHYSYFK